MPTRNVVLTDHQAVFVEQLVANGRYQNASEVLREGLRLVELNHLEHAAKTRAVEVHPDVVSGAWVFRGTRVPVSALFENLRDGATVDDFLEWFPGVDRSDVQAVLDSEASALKIVAAA